MTDADSLIHSESMTDLPQILRDQLEAGMDFDLFRPLSNSTIKEKEIDDENDLQQFKMLQKLDILGQANLTEILEEVSEMEVSQYPELSKIQSQAFLKGLGSAIKLEEMMCDNEILLLSNRSIGLNDKSTQKFEESHDTKLLLKEFEETSPFSKIKPPKKPDTWIVRSFIVPSDSTFIIEDIKLNCNIPDIISIENTIKNDFELANFKRKPTDKKTNDNEINDKKISVKDNIDNVGINENAAQTIKKIVQHVNEKHRNPNGSQIRSRNFDNDSISRSNEMPKNNNYTDKFKTPKQGKALFDSDGEANGSKRGSLFIDLYRKGDKSANGQLNIYKKRNMSINSLKNDSMPTNQFHLSKSQNIRNLSYMTINGNNKNGINIKNSSSKDYCYYMDSNYKQLASGGKGKGSKLDFKVRSDLMKKVTMSLKKTKKSKKFNPSLKSMMSPSGFQSKKDLLLTSNNKRQVKLNSIQNRHKLNFYTSVENLHKGDFSNKSKNKSKLITDFCAGTNIYMTLRSQTKETNVKSSKRDGPMNVNQSKNINTKLDDIKYNKRTDERSSDVVLKNMKKRLQSETEIQKQSTKKSVKNISPHESFNKSKLIMQYNNNGGFGNKEINAKTGPLQTIMKKTINLDKSHLQFKSIQLRDLNVAHAKDYKFKDLNFQNKPNCNHLDRNRTTFDRTLDMTGELLYSGKFIKPSIKKPNK